MLRSNQDIKRTVQRAQIGVWVCAAPVVNRDL